MSTGILVEINNFGHMQLKRDAFQLRPISFSGRYTRGQPSIPRSFQPRNEKSCDWTIKGGSEQLRNQSRGGLVRQRLLLVVPRLYRVTRADR